mgnify:CR=1 FL=1
MAYMNKKKKRYNVNKNVPKAQAGNWGGGGAGGSLEDVWGGMKDVVSNIVDSAGNITSGSITRSGSEVPSNKYANLSSQDLKKIYGKDYDFALLDEKLDRTKNSTAFKGTTGRHNRWAQMFHTPENVNFNYTDSEEQLPGIGTNSHNYNLSAMMLDAPTDVIRTLQGNAYNLAPRKYEGTKSVQERHGLPTDGPLYMFDKRFLSEIDEKKIEDQRRKQKKNYNFKGHIHDLDLMRDLLNMPELTSQQADMINQQINSPMFNEALASQRPGDFDPGVRGPDKDGRYGAYSIRSRQDLTKNKDKFINAPMNYQMNMEASGLGANEKPNQEWLHIQHLSNQGASEGGSGGHNAGQVAEMLMGDESVFAKNKDQRGEFQYEPGFRGGEGHQVFNFGVRYDKKKGQHYSEGRNRFLTPEEERTYREQVVNKYVTNSGWQQYNPTTEIEPISIGSVPSGKTDQTLAPPTGGPVSFIDDASDVVEETISEIGGETEVKEGVSRRGNRGLKQSIDAILTSMKNKTHIKTGEEYNNSDFKRDAAIIKREFGNEAYDNLLDQTMGMDLVPPASSTPIVESGDGDIGDGGSDPLSFNVIPNSDDEEEEEDDGMSYSQQVQEFVYGSDDDDDDDDDDEEEVSSGVDYGAASSAFAGDGDTGSGSGSGSGSSSGFVHGMLSPFEMREMMAKGETPMYKKGGFGKNFNMDKMKFYEDGGTTWASPVAAAFGGRGGGGGLGIRGGFDIPAIYESSREQDTVKSGEVYLSAKIMRMESELSKLDPNDPANQDALAALQQELEESKIELMALKGITPPPQ